MHRPVFVAVFSSRPLFFIDTDARHIADEIPDFLDGGLAEWVLVTGGGETGSRRADRGATRQGVAMGRQLAQCGLGIGGRSNMRVDGIRWVLHR
mgnify:CR=1 FL=1